jgi:cell division protein FtsN
MSIIIVVVVVIIIAVVIVIVMQIIKTSEDNALNLQKQRSAGPHPPRPDGRQLPNKGRKKEPPSDNQLKEATRCTKYQPRKSQRTSLYTEFGVQRAHYKCYLCAPEANQIRSKILCR